MLIYKRLKNRCPTLMDFEDDEEIFFYCYPDQSSKKAFGLAWYVNKKGYTRLLPKNEVIEIEE